MTREFRFALRSLSRQRGFTLTTVLTLGLAIGFVGVIFSLVRGVLLEPLPYPDPEQLLVLMGEHPERGRGQVSAADLADWKRRSRTLDSIGAYRYWGFTYTGGDEPRDLPGVLVTPNLLKVLGVPPAVGRGFTPEEGVPGNDKVVLLSHGFWQRRFGGDRGVIGSPIELDAERYLVVGVMPEDFEFPPDEEAEVWGPLAIDTAEVASRRQVRDLNIFARSSPDASVDEVRTELSRIAVDLAAAHSDTNAGWGVAVVPAREQLLGRARTALLIVFAAVGLLLLIACVNAANLMIARLVARRRDIAVRAGLGAGRRDLVRQFLAESLLLSIAGGLLGLLLTWWGVWQLHRVPGRLLPRLDRVEADATVALFVVALSLVVGLALGLIPAIQSSRPRLAGELKEGSGSSGGVRSRRTLDALVVAEVALAMVLSVSAGLLARSYLRLSAVDPGFDPRNVLSANVFLPDGKYPEDSQQQAFFDQVLERLRTLPGIESAGAVTALPLDQVGIDFDLPFEVEGRDFEMEGEGPQADFRVATPGYFDTLRIPLLTGRGFDSRDHAEAPRVMLINETMVDRYFDDRSPIGRRVSIPFGGDHEVIGVVGDVHHRGLDSEPRPEMYVPFAQSPFGSMVVVARARTSPEVWIQPFKEQIWSVDPEQPIYALNTMRELVAQSLAIQRLSLILMALFAVAAFVLAAVGIYGVMSYIVNERTREIGIRMALGAALGDTVRMILRHGLVLAAVGVAVGALGAVLTTHLLRGLLFGVTPLDPAVLVLAAALLLLIALVANGLPARRAARLDPVLALRNTGN